jgi:hypothetical protein
MIGNREIKTQIRFDFFFIFDICNTKIKIIFPMYKCFINFQSDITIGNAEQDISLDGLAQ